jgi:NAD(P)-dependent dehydrogenase (short-subunit alcohol dehydrogenase family)
MRGLLEMGWFSYNLPMLDKIRNLNSQLQHQGKTALVVGGTSGIGRGIARRLSKAGFDVTIAGRNEDAAKQVVQELNEFRKGNHSYILCDAQYVKTGLQFAEKLKHDKLDVLVLTQGIATIQGRTETSEGIDQKMALHYYSRVAFTLGLLPLLRKSSTPSVLSVLSPGIHPAYSKYQEDPQLKKNYTLADAANATCFYNDLACEQLSILPGNEVVRFTHAAPGAINTNWGREFPWYIRLLLKPIKPFLRSIDDCAEYLCQGILQKHNPGFFLIDQYGEPAPKRKEHTADAREFIWNDTIDIMRANGWNGL